jgi:hypothetical protein
MKYGIGMASLVVAVASVMAAPAYAAVEVNEVGANAVSHCQGNLPASETTLRKRPLALQNESTTGAFVTCSFSTQYDSDDIGEIGYFGVFLNNNSAAAKSVTCTAVAGFDSNTTNVFINKTVVVPAGGEGEMFFEAADNGGNGYFPLVNLSCNLPGGTGIADTYAGFNVDDA